MRIGNRQLHAPPDHVLVLRSGVRAGPTERPQATDEVGAGDGDELHAHEAVALGKDRQEPGRRSGVGAQDGGKRLPSPGGRTGVKEKTSVVRILPKLARTWYKQGRTVLPSAFYFQSPQGSSPQRVRLHDPIDAVEPLTGRLLAGGRSVLTAWRLRRSRL